MKIIVNLVGTLVGIILIALLTVLLLAPNAVIEFLGRLEDVQLPLRLGLVVVIYLVALMIFSIRVRLTPRGESDALTVRTSDSVASVTVESVRERVLKTVGDVPSVASVEANVKSVGGRADIDLNVVTTDDTVNIPEKQKEISRVIDQVIKKQLGLQLLGRPRINIQLGDPRAVVASGTKPAPVVSRDPAPVTFTPAPPAVITPPVAAPPPPSDTGLGSSSDRVSATNTPVIPASPIQEETPAESQGFLSRFGMRKSDESSDEEVSVVRTPTSYTAVSSETADTSDEDDLEESDAAFYSMLEESRENAALPSDIDGIDEDEATTITDEEQDSKRNL